MAALSIGAGTRQILDLVHERTGLTFDSRSRSDVEAGITRAMARTKVGDSASYLARVAGSREAFDALLDELTVGETYFFRSIEHFSFIKTTVLPDIARLRGPGHVWLQSLPISRMAGRILSAARGSRKGEGSILGGLGNLLDGD